MQNNDRNVETIKVKHKDGFMIINKSDFNKDIHDEYDETNQDLQKMNKDVVPESLPEAQAEKEEEPVDTKDDYDFEDEFEGVDPEGIIVPKKARKARNNKKDETDSRK